MTRRREDREDHSLDWYDRAMSEARCRFEPLTRRFASVGLTLTVEQTGGMVMVGFVAGTHPTRRIGISDDGLGSLAMLYQDWTDVEDIGSPVVSAMDWQRAMDSLMAEPMA